MRRAVLLLNAFSLNMLGDLQAARTSLRRLALDEASELAVGAESAVGHEDTAAVFGALLGVLVPCRRATVTLAPGDTALVGQYVGPRLPPGARNLPGGAEIRWFEVRIGDI